MDNYRNIDNKHRRYLAHLSITGTTQLHLQNPYIIAWWSAAFPGFGHFLLNKYLRGSALFIWEVVVNQQAHINLAMIQTFGGNYELAKVLLDQRWMLMYIPVYLFAIWDSYRTTVDINSVYILAKREKAPFNSFSLGTFEINYLDRRNPLMSVIWSLFMPGLGQLHIHRIVASLFIMIWSIVFFYYSHLFEAVQLLFFGKIPEATKILNKQWLLYLPSLWGFAAYDSYINTVENNKLFKMEQQTFLINHFQNPSFKVKREIVVDAE